MSKHLLISGTGDFARTAHSGFIASHIVISGNCRVGDNTFIGVNATVRDGITIGQSCVIGATEASVITSDRLRKS